MALQVLITIWAVMVERRPNDNSTGATNALCLISETKTYWMT